MGRGLRIGARALAAVVGVLLVLSWLQPPFSDEIASTGRNFFTFARDRTFLPGHHAYGTLYSYLAAVPGAVGVLAGAASAGRSVVAEAYVDWYVAPERLLPWLRVPSLLAGAGLLVFLGRRALRSRRPVAGLVVVAGLAFWPPLLRYAGLAVPDVLAAALIVAAFALRERVDLLRHRLGWRWVVPGVVAGLAIGTKYTVVPVAAGLVLAPLLPRVEGAPPRSRIVDLGVTWAGIAIGFVAATPGWLFQPGRFLDALAREWVHVAQAGHLGDWGTDGLWLVQSLWPGGVLLVVGAVLVCAVSRPTLRAPAVSPAFWGVAVAAVVLWSAEKKSAHYLIPLLAVAAFGLIGPPADADDTRRQRKRLALAALVVLALAQCAVAAVRVMAESFGDGRVEAAAFLRRDVGPSDTVWLAPDYVPVVTSTAPPPWALRGDVPADARRALDAAWDELPRAGRVVRSTAPDLESLRRQSGRVLLVTASGWHGRFLDSIPPQDHPQHADALAAGSGYRLLVSGTDDHSREIAAFGWDGGNRVTVFELVGR